VASEAGLNQGLLHHYFKTKALTAKRAILRAALNATVAKLVTLSQGARSARDAQAQLRLLIQGLLELDRDTRLVLLQFSTAIMQDQEVRRLIANAYEELRRNFEQMIRGGVQRHLFRRLRPAEASFIILGLVEGIAIQRTLDPGAMASAEASRICLEAVTSYLSKQDRARSPYP
jgi:AcrR family transcriptional regulator